MRNLLYFVLGPSGNSLEGIQALTHRKTACLQDFEHLSRVRNSTEGEVSVAGATNSRSGRTPSQSPVKCDWPGACALSERCAWAQALVPSWLPAQSRQSVAQASLVDRRRSILRITWSRESHEISTFSYQRNHHRLRKVLSGPTHSSLLARNSIPGRLFTVTRIGSLPCTIL
jgi:hypothetical protein